MLVHHFNRDPRPANYTFEQLFGALREEVGKSMEIANNNLPGGLNQFQAIKWAKSRKGKINHITGDVNYLAYGLPSKGLIITVHDLGHYTRSLSGVKKIIYKKFWLDGPFAKANKITAISEFTKNELINRLGISEGKIVVIKNPIIPGITFSPLPNNPKPVILQVGSGTNKNVLRLLEAVKGIEVKLLLVNRLLDPIVNQKLKDYNIDYEKRSDLDLEGLNNAYANADLLFFASEYEGFGLPILEAQAAGRPVITSNLASMPEAAGTDGALLIDPFDVEAIRQAIVNLIESNDLKKKLIQTGLQNLKSYQIEDIAQQYIKLYHEVEED